LENKIGLSTVLECEDVSVADVLQAVPVADLSVMTAGPMPDSPSEMLGSKRMGDLIELLEQYADILVFDAPPVMAVSDAAILASRLDGILLVVDAGQTRRGAAQRSKETLVTVGGRVLGVALNRAALPQSGYYYYYYTAEDGERRKRRSRGSQLAHLFRRNGHDADKLEEIPAQAQEPVGERSEIGAEPDKLED
jgi:capsular exopolysaccharide synthesis family protein